jgi:hypothetical protein
MAVTSRAPSSTRRAGSRRGSSLTFGKPREYHDQDRFTDNAPVLRNVLSFIRRRDRAPDIALGYPSFDQIIRLTAFGVCE